MDSKIVNQWEEIPEIPKGLARNRHTIVVYQDALYLFGGLDGQVPLNDLFCFDIKSQSWNKVVTTGEIPSPRGGHAAVIYKSSMFVFGGYSPNNPPTNQLFEYKFNTKEWTQCKCTGNQFPAGRSGHVVVVYGDRLWLFYGHGCTDLWSISLLSGSARQWTQLKQVGDCPTKINHQAVTVSSNYMFALGERNDIKSIFKFIFNEHKWLCLKNLPKLNRDYNLVGYEDQLFVLTDPEFYSFNLDTQMFSVIKFTSSHDFYGLQYSSAVVTGGAMYICDSNCHLFKCQLPPNYSKVCTLRADYNKVFEQQLLCDVEFLVGINEQVKIPAHIPIVVARSHWLRDSIRQQLHESNATINDSGLLQVMLPNVDPDIFQMVLSYIYTDQIKPSKDNILLILDLHKLAGEIGLKRLEQLIIEQLIEPNLKVFVNLSNVLDVLSKAYVFELLPVTEFCLKFITEDPNCKTIMKSKKFISLDSRLLVEIIEKKQIKSNETAANSQPLFSDTSNLSLKADMKVFMETIGEEFSDITLVLGKDRIPAHKCILAARCSYFESMFRSFMPSDNTVRIQIGDVIPSREAFDFLLKYIYYDETKLPLNHLDQLVAAPSFYGFTNNNRLFEMFKINLKEFVTVEHVVEVLKAAEEAQEHEITNYILDTYFF